MEERNLNITIMKPETAHAKAIADICSFGWKQTVDGKLSEEYQKKNIEYWYNHDKVYDDILAGLYTYVAVYEQDVVGVIGCGVTGEDSAQIFVLYVDATHRYKGIGRQLLEKITTEHKDKGITKQLVSVEEDNQLGIPFYEASGFVLQNKKVSYTDTKERHVALQYLREI